MAKILPKGANVRDNSAPKPIAVESRDRIKTNLEQINEKRLNEPCTSERMLVKSIPNEGEEIEKIVRNKSGPLTLGY